MQRRNQSEASTDVLDESLPYDDFLKPTNGGNPNSPFSQWGPNRPQHSMLYPQKSKRTYRYVLKMLFSSCYFRIVT